MLNGAIATPMEETVLKKFLREVPDIFIEYKVSQMLMRNDE